MLKIRRPLGRLIFNMGIAIPGKTVFLIETGPRPQWVELMPRSRSLWWASQVIGGMTMTKIEVSIYILWWWNKLMTHIQMLSRKMLSKTCLGYRMVTCARLVIVPWEWPDCFTLVTHVVTTVMSQQGLCDYNSVLHFMKIGKNNPVLFVEIGSRMVKSFDKMIFEKYKLFTEIKLANCTHNNVILGIFHNYIHSRLLSIAFQNLRLNLTMGPFK